MSIYLCCDERRRDAARAQTTLNGIEFNGLDYLEVVDETILLLHFIHPLRAGVVSKENVQISGGESIPQITVLDVALFTGQEAAESAEERGHRSRILKVTADRPGDYSIYTLSVKADPRRLILDPMLSTIEFTFRLPADALDCAQEQLCVPETQFLPVIDYMAKDYNSFRQLMLDRMSALMPQWTERSPADAGVMLVELLAYVADYLSYQQDVIATESYLSTARLRISARRHARLLDYAVNEGCNAHVWVQVRMQDSQKVTVNAGARSVFPDGTAFLTRVSDLNKIIIAPDSPEYRLAQQAQPTVFEPVMNIDGLYADHNTLYFYTWGDRECCLPAGSTEATLRGAFPNLEPGNVLVFQERVDPHTGQEADAEPTHRHAVRLTSVLIDSDPLGTWPNDHAPPEEDPQGLGRVIAEYRIVEDERLRVEDAELTSAREGYRVELQQTREEKDTHTTIKRYIIEKPDKTRVTVEVRVRHDEKDVYVYVEEFGHAVREEQETREVEVKRSEEISIAPEQQEPPPPGGNEEEESNTAPEQQEPPPLDGDGEEEAEEEEEDLDDIARQPTQKKLPRLPFMPEEPETDIEEMETIEMQATQLPPYEHEHAQMESSEEREETTIEEAEESEKRDREQEEEMKVETRTVKVRTYRIIREREADYSQPITRIAWGDEDALPFPLCISATTDYGHEHTYIEDVSIALGNIVLADNGLTQSDVKQQNIVLIPNVVPESTLNWAAPAGQRCEEQQVEPVPPRFYPRLKYAPLTFVAPDAAGDPATSATALMNFDTRDAVPSITLFSGASDQLGENPPTWQAKPDLLASSPTDRHFSVEIEADGSAYLRFGDNQHGLRPDTGTHFLATYRVGNGTAGNIGREALYHIVTDDPTLQGAIQSIGNPLPASGGREPESVEQIRQHAAGSLTEQARGVTPQDYITLATQEPQVHRANAMLRWTGSWYTVFLAVERAHMLPVDDAFRQALLKRLGQYRLAGTDLVIIGPVYVPLEIHMTAYYKEGYLPGDMETALLKVFSNRQWPDGQRGVFYPDNYGFGEPVYLNSLYVAAQAIPGIARVDINTFQRQGIPGTGLQDGVLPMRWQEIAVLENNPYYPERGLFHLTLTESEAQYARS